MEQAEDIQCRAKGSGLNHTQTGDDVRHCDASRGLLCVNRNDTHDFCSDYEVRYKCPLDNTGIHLHNLSTKYLTHKYNVIQHIGVESRLL